LLLASLPLWGCNRHSGGYTLLDVPKELQVDAAALSEDVNKLMSVDETTPLLAALPEEGLYVYATDETVVSGVLVKYDGLLQYFSWRFAPRLAQPELFVSDYNEDGRKDIAFVYVSKAGDHARRENLHVLLRADNGFVDNFYACEKATIDAGKHLSVYADEDGQKADAFTAYLDGIAHPFTLPGHGEFLELNLDEVLDFTLGDEITLKIEPGLFFRNEGPPLFDVMTYTAHIEFVNGVLTQTKTQIDL
jgi:hypothetical protein